MSMSLALALVTGKFETRGGTPHRTSGSGSLVIRQPFCSTIESSQLFFNIGFLTKRAFMGLLKLDTRSLGSYGAAALLPSINFMPIFPSIL